jgi:ABC-type uncharacterized transport system ATPase subunit/ABC-type uncharacterized transport system permease subunit
VSEAGARQGGGTGVSDTVPALELRDITKSFGDLVANDHISLTVAPGEVHSIVGENGAGKTTLMNVCFGILQPDEGEILVDGVPVRMASPVAARAHGIGMVHQHFKLVESLTVAENVFLGAEETHGLYTLDRSRMIGELTEVSNRFGLEVDPARRVERLSAGQRQRVEILKALYFDAKILILDEPTAVLTPQESDKLFDVLRGLAAAGRTIILITHKLREVLAVADRYTVIRLGKVVADGDTAGATEEEIATLMVGREVRFGRTEPIPDRRPAVTPALTCSGLVVEDADGHVRVDGVSLDLRPGEITGIAGVEGNGQTELIRALAGLQQAVSGSVHMGGRDITHTSPADRRTAGIAHIPEDRLVDGVAATATVIDNMVGGFLRSNLFRRGILSARLATDWAASLIRRYDVRGAQPRTKVGSLSGGNIQKVVVARELETDPEVLLAAQPSRGVDVGAMEFIHSQLRARRDAGAAVLVVSADLSELLALADRILVMYRGKIVAEFAPAEELVPRIGLAMAGAADARDVPAESVPEQTRAPEQARHATQVAADVTAPARAAFSVTDPASWGPAAARLTRGVGIGLVQPVLAVVIALAIGIAIVLALGDDPAAAYRGLLFGSFSDELNFSAMIAQAIPLVLIAASVYLSFRGGIFNIGAEGQMYAGAFVGGVLGAKLSGLPGPLLIIVCMITGAIGGGIVGYVAGALDAYLGVDVLVTTLMLNYIVQNITAYLSGGPMRDPTAGRQATESIAPQAHLPTIIGQGGANIGIIIGFVVLFVVGFVFLRTRWGLQARFVGDNRHFSRYLGVDVRGKITQIVVWSGAIAGLAGVIASLGTQFRFVQAFSPGYGFIGITVALLGRLNPIGIAIAALFYGTLEQGASVMQFDTNVPLSLVNVLEGLIIILMTATALQLTRRRRTRVTGESLPDKVTAGAETAAAGGGA